MYLLNLAISLSTDIFFSNSILKFIKYIYNSLFLIFFSLKKKLNKILTKSKKQTIALISNKVKNNKFIINVSLEKIYILVFD